MGDDATNVLLVEDNLADVALLTALLEDTDAEYWQVIHVKRLSLALEHLQTNPFDVILLDLSLPDSQGLDTVTQIKTAAPHLPIVVLTGLQDQTIARQAVAQGAQDYLVKGQLSPELLLKTVNYAIERAQILKKLQDNEHRFRGVFNQTLQFMSLLSSDGVVLDINQATREVIGFPDEAVINRSIWEAPYWKSSQSRSWLRQAVLRASEGETMRSELRAYTSTGTLCWLDFSLKPLKDENNSIVLLIAEGRDISKLKQAEIEIRQSYEKERELNQMKTSFISMVSHEFRNPMATIRLANTMLQDCNFPAEKKAQYFEKIRNATDQMLKLLDEVLLLGRTEAGKVEVEPTLFDLEQFCQEVVESFQFLGDHQHQILFSAHGHSRQARMDAVLLRHILDNLLSNAIKYSPKGGIIRFTLTCQGDQAHFCIQDQGIGIPKQDQAKLFETFHRATNVCKIQGTGLGLAIVKRCVDLQNGQIYVESQEDVGTTFTVILPLNLPSVEQEKFAESHC